tara:strand:- start:295 stop:474 length:180 start_codon:yes stop_codon:yes gene_type:complete
MEENKYVQRAKRVEKRINSYSLGTESFVINSINLLQDILLDLNSKPKETKKDDSKKKGG